MSDTAASPTTAARPNASEERDETDDEKREPGHERQLREAGIRSDDLRFDRSEARTITQRDRIMKRS